MKFLLAYLLLSLAITGCQFGPKIENFAQARRPEGITASIELRGGIAARQRVEGELLEVREDGLLLNTREAGAGGVVRWHLMFVPYTAMEAVGIEELNLRVLKVEDSGVEGEAASPGSRERDRETLRLLSRFPQGLSPPLLEALLAAEGQTNVEVIGGE
jgi:hypothetical protein